MVEGRIEVRLNNSPDGCGPVVEHLVRNEESTTLVTGQGTCLGCGLDPQCAVGRR